jgi:hypothetical protein
MTSKLHVQFYTHEKQAYELFVSPQTTVGQMKTLLTSELGIPVNSLKLKAKVLKDDDRAEQLSSDSRILVNPKNVAPPTESLSASSLCSSLPVRRPPPDRAILKKKIDEMMFLGIEGITRRNCEEALRAVGYFPDRAIDWILENRQWVPLTEVPFSREDIAFLTSMSQEGKWSPRVIVQAFESVQRNRAEARAELQRM